MAPKTTTHDFTGSVVLVTGGGSGIGAAITRAFLDAGATVAVTGRRRERLEQVLEGHPAERTAAMPPTSPTARRCATSWPGSWSGSGTSTSS